MEKPPLENPKPKVDYSKLRPLNAEKGPSEPPDADLRREAFNIKKRLGDKEERTVWEIFQALRAERYGGNPEPRKDN